MLRDGLSTSRCEPTYKNLQQRSCYQHLISLANVCALSKSSIGNELTQETRVVGAASQSTQALAAQRSPSHASKSQSRTGSRPNHLYTSVAAMWLPAERECALRRPQRGYVPSTWSSPRGLCNSESLMEHPEAWHHGNPQDDRLAAASEHKPPTAPMPCWCFSRSAKVTRAM